jgi:hypothetical protein
VTGVPGDFGNHAQIDESQAHGADKVVFGSVVEVVVRRYCQDLLIGERRADSVRTPGQYRTAGRSIHRLGVRSVGVSFA